jgi:leader peptidase (prepilin peptidase)/N-methyltransferase
MNEISYQMEQTISLVLQGMMWKADLPVTLLVGFFLWFTGCVIASFAGLVADRLPGILKFGDDDRGALYPASSCDGCGRQIPLLDLIPVIGWVACGGKCRACGHGVSRTYPAMEFAIGVMSAIIPPLIGDPHLAITALILFWSSVIIVWCDVRHHIIPEFVTIPLLIAGLLFSPIPTDYWERIAGCAVAGGTMWITFLFVSKVRGIDAFSGGDVALLACGGAWLGVDIAPAFMLFSAVAFLAYGIPLRRKGISWVPMGPAIAAALVTCSFAPVAMESLTTAMIT